MILRVPPLIVAALAVPPADTISRPPLFTSLPISMPPDRTSS
jgi:hypothetical protein